MESEELRTLRKRLGLSMAACCRLTGTPYRTWQNWETVDGINARRVPGIAFAWLELYAEIRGVI